MADMARHVITEHAGENVRRCHMSAHDIGGDLIKANNAEAFRWLHQHKDESAVNIGYGGEADKAYVPPYVEGGYYVVDSVGAPLILPYADVVSSFFGAERANYEGWRVDIARHEERLGYKTRAGEALAQVAAILAKLEDGDPFAPLG